MDAQPNIEWPLREPSEGTYEAFRSYFHFWLVSQVFGGPLVSPQGYDDVLEVTWGGASPAGLSQATRPEGHVGDFPVGIIFRSGLQIG